MTSVSLQYYSCIFFYCFPSGVQHSIPFSAVIMTSLLFFISTNIVNSV